MYLIQSPLKTKKLRAMFSDNTHTDFGQRGAPDFTITKDVAQRQRSLNRHRKNENWNDPRSAGALSRYILWGEHSSIEANLRDYKIRFAGKI